MRGGGLKVTLLDPVLENSSKEPSNFAVIQGAAPEALTSLGAGSFDVVIAFDLIEHMSKEDGYLLLYEMERIARHLVVVYTPTGFLWQPPSPNNYLNAHVSGWVPRDFKQFGFRKIVGIFGFKIFMGPYSEPRYPSLSSKFPMLMKISQVFARRLPSLAHSIYCEKAAPGVAGRNQPLN